MKEHFVSKAHLNPKSVKDAEQLQKGEPAVAQLVSAQNDDVISTSTHKLKSILASALFYARQNIALLGHRIERYNPESRKRPAQKSHGNF